MFVAIWQVSCDPDGYFLIWSFIIKLSPWSLTHKPLERISVQVLYLLCIGCNVTSLGSCHINIQSCKKYSGVKKWLRICMITWIMQFCLVLSCETFQSLHATQDVFMSVPFKYSNSVKKLKVFIKARKNKHYNETKGIYIKQKVML